MTEYVCVSNNHGAMYHVGVGGDDEVSIHNPSGDTVFFLPHASLLRALLLLAEDAETIDNEC